MGQKETQSPQSLPNTTPSPIRGGEVAVVVAATAHCIRVATIIQLKKMALLLPFLTDHFVLTILVCSMLGQQVFL
jgi:hypothetical protein